MFIQLRKSTRCERDGKWFHPAKNQYVDSRSEIDKMWAKFCEAECCRFAAATAQPPLLIEDMNWGQAFTSLLRYIVLVSNVNCQRGLESIQVSLSWRCLFCYAALACATVKPHSKAMPLLVLFKISSSQHCVTFYVWQKYPFKLWLWSLDMYVSNVMRCNVMYVCVHIYIFIHTVYCPISHIWKWKKHSEGVTAFVL